MMSLSLDKYPVLRFVAALVISFIGALLIILLTLKLTSDDISQLTMYMAATGLLTFLISYTVYRLGIVQWFGSLRWTVAATIVLTVLLVFLNVWVMARVMFRDFHYLTLTTALLIFAGLSAIMFGFFIARALIDRICEVADAAMELSTGKLDTRLVVTGNDELAHLASSFNLMAKGLQELDEQKRQLEQTRRNLVAWVSHDLRTPLAAMRVMIEALSDGVVTDEETVKRYLDTSRAEIEHLNRLINDLFDLAQLDVGHLDMTFYQASVRDLISDTIGSMTPKATSRNITLKGEVADDVDTAFMAPDKIQRVLYNLVDNAIKYTPPGETVTITARRTGEMAQIDVHNSGTYIEAQEHLFESFYRGESSRAKSGSGDRGAGLGLAIARAFVEANQGTIWLESSPEKGTTFSFTIPRWGK